MPCQIYGFKLNQCKGHESVRIDVLIKGTDRDESLHSENKMDLSSASLGWCLLALLENAKEEQVIQDTWLDCKYHFISRSVQCM